MNACINALKGSCALAILRAARLPHEILLECLYSTPAGTGAPGVFLRPQGCLKASQKSYRVRMMLALHRCERMQPILCFATASVRL